MVTLFHQVCRPIGRPETQGAFLFGLRLMAIDGTVEEVPDTPENAAVFGRHTGGRGASAFPLVRGVYLCECGTHAIVDAGFWPYHTGERVGEFQMTAPDQPNQLYDRLLRDIAATRLPERLLSVNPRGVKRKMSKFLVKRPEHYHWPQPSKPFRQAVALIRRVLGLNAMPFK